MGALFKEPNMSPKLKFEKYCSETGNKVFIGELVLQDHSPEHEIELFRYEYNKRGERIVIPNGTINARKHASGILAGTRPIGYIYSFAQAYAKNNQHEVNDHIIASFTGYSDGKGAYTAVLNLGSTIAYIEAQKKPKPVVDDKELLMKKFNAIKS